MGDYNYDYNYSGTSGSGFTFDDTFEEVKNNSTDTTIIIFYAIITAIGLVANGIVLFVIVAGNEIGEFPFLY